MRAGCTSHPNTSTRCPDNPNPETNEVSKSRGLDKLRLGCTQNEALFGSAKDDVMQLAAYMDELGVLCRVKLARGRGTDSEWSLLYVGHRENLQWSNPAKGDRNEELESWSPQRKLPLDWR